MRLRIYASTSQSSRKVSPRPGDSVLKIDIELLKHGARPRRRTRSCGVAVAGSFELLDVRVRQLDALVVSLEWPLELSTR